jgi:hypothetical protein
MGLFSTPSQPANQAIKYTGLQIQTSVNTLPVPIVMGTAKLAPNLIDYDDYQAKGQQQGGKGLGGGGSATTYEYYATVIMALCEGPIQGINNIWKGNSTYTLSSLGLTLFSGATPQTAWSYMTSKHPDKALGYNGAAYVAVANYDLGGSPTVDNHNFEVKGIHAGTGPNGFDADPTHCIMELLTNPQFGAGFPASSIDTASLGLGNYQAGGTGSTTSYGRDAGSLGAYCQALGICFSACLTSVETAASILDRWCKVTNCAAVWSGTTLKFIPYGDTPVAGDGASFTPNVTPVYDLTDDDFVGDATSDPVEVTRSDVADAKNVVRVEISDRTNAYNLTPIESRDETMVNLYGLRVDSAVTANEICDPAVAATVGQLILQRGLYIRNTYQFKLSWEYCLLEPMDLVTLTDSGLGLAQTAVRITAIEEDDQGLLTVTAEEFPAGIATATQYPKQARSPYALNFDIAPPSVNTPVIFEPQSSLTGGDAEVWIGVSGSGIWGGCYVWLSADGTTYENIGKIDQPARQGVLTAALPAFTGTNPDTADTLGVDLTMSGGTLLNATTADAAAARTLFYAGGELMAYATATLTSANHYNLTGLQRGLYGTTAAAHGSGSQFLRLDSSIFKYPLPAQYVGGTIYLKFQSFNIWGGGLQDLSGLTAYTYGPNGEGYLVPVPAGALDFSATIPSAPSGLIAAGGQNIIVVNWQRNPEADVLGYLVWSAEGHDADFADAAIVAQVNATTWTHANLGYGETRAYWVEAYSRAGSSNPTGPAYATTAYTIPVEAIGANAISQNQLIPILQQAIANIEAVSQGAVVAAAQAGLAQSQIAQESYVRASADQANAALITTVQASLNGSIATVQSNLSVEVSDRETLASSVTTLTTTVAGNTASIAENVSSINGLQARYTVQVEVDTDGNKYIGGFGLLGSSDGSGGIVFNATFLVTSFTIAQLNGDGTTSSVAPFTVSGGNVVIQDALIGSLAANKITSGTISTANIVIQPATSGDGLKLYDVNGNIVLDPTHGVYPGQATIQPTQTFSGVSYPGNNAWGTVLDLGSQTYLGRFAIAAIVFNVPSSVYDGLQQSFSLRLLLDGAVVANWSGVANNNYCFDVALPGYVMGAGSHDIKIEATSGRGDLGSMSASGAVTICDFKA